MLAGRDRPQSLRPLLRDFGCVASGLCLTAYLMGRMHQDKIQGVVPPDLDSYRF